MHVESATDAVRVIDAGQEGGLVLDPGFLFSADFLRLGDDLLLRGPDGEEILIEGYFTQSPPPALETPEGARLTGETVEAMAQTSVPQQWAQAGGIQLGEPIGHVNLLNGQARVQRADGTRENLNDGDPIFQGDVVSTGVGSELGILFIDETVFSLSANARMLINELIYNPSSTTNSMGVSLIQGTFVFVTGQVAPTGGIQVDTPVGTIGIRGTTVGVEITSFGGFTTIANLVNPDTGELGSFTFSNAAGSALFNLANHYLEVRSANQAPGTPGQATPQDISDAWGRALNTAVQIQRQVQQQQNDDEPDVDPTTDQEGELDGDVLQALQEAGLTPEQIQEILDAPPIETAAGPGEGGQGSGSSGNQNTPSSGSGVGGSEQSEAVQTPNGSTNGAQGGVGGLPTQGTIPENGVTPPPPPPTGSGDQGTNPPPGAPTTTGNTPPTLVTNSLLVNPGQAVTVSAANFNAADSDGSALALTFTITGLTGGQFELVSNPGVPVTSFTQAQVIGAQVVFVDDGDATPPSYNVAVSDGQAQTAPAPAVVVFNTPPVLDTALVAVTEGSSVTLSGANFAASDGQTPAGSLVFNLTGVGGGQFEFTANPGVAITSFTQAQVTGGQVKFVHDGGEAGPSYLVSVSDGLLSTPPVAGGIGFVPVDDAPVLVNNALTLDEGETVVLTPANLSATDADNADAGIVFFVSDVTGGFFAQVNAPTTAISNFTQQQVIDGDIIFVDDGDETPPSYDVALGFGFGTTAPQAAAIDYTAVNDDPVAEDDAVATGENTVLNGSVFADNGSGADSDAEGDTLSVTAVNGVPGDVGQTIVLNSGALLTLNGDGTFVYDPNGAFDSLGSGDSAVDSFTYTLGDGNGGSDVATVDVTVNGQNSQPVAEDDQFFANEDDPLNDNVLTGGGLPDSDPDLDLLTVTAVNGVPANVGQTIVLTSGALLTLNSNGTFTYDPNGAFEYLNDEQSETDSFTYTISDGNGGSDDATVNIDVGGINDVPVGAVSTGLVVIGTTTPVTTAILSATDAETSDSSLLTFTVTGTTNGQVLVNGFVDTTFTLEDIENGVVSFQQDGTSAPGAGFTVTVADPDGGVSGVFPVSFNVATGFVWTNAAADLDWDNPANWLSGSVPVAGADVLIQDVGSAVFTSGTLALGTVTLDPGATLNVGGGSLTVDDISDDATSTLALTDGTFTLNNNVFLQGNLLWPGNVLNGSGTLTVGGQASLGGLMSLNTGLILEGPSTLTGTFNGSGSITNNGNLTAQGFPNVGVDFDNTSDGTVTLDGAGSAVNLQFTAGFTQSGVVVLTSTGSASSATLTVTGAPFTNDGTVNVEVGAGGARNIQGEIVNYGEMTFNAATGISGGADYSNEDDGEWNVNADVTISGATDFRNSGTMTLLVGTTLLLTTGDFLNDATGIINGNGTLDLDGGTLTNNGTINPGASPGTLTIDGDYVQGADGQLTIELDENAGDVLVVTGTATFAGTVVVTLLDEFVPEAGDVLNFIQAGAIVDNGVLISGNTYGGGILGVQLAGGTVSLVAINGSGDIDVGPYDIIVGETAFGELSIDAGQNIASQLLIVGDDPSGNGELSVTNESQLTINGPSIIGNFGTGNATIAGAAQAEFINPGGVALAIGARDGGTGNLTVSYNSLVDPDQTQVDVQGDGARVIVGGGGTGSLTLDNGFFTVDGDDARLLVGVEAGSQGSVSLINGGSAALYMSGDNSYMAVGVEGEGLLEVNDSGAAIHFFGSDNVFALGAEASGVGTLQLGGTLGMNGSVRIGDWGTGNATVTGGGHLTAGSDNFDNLVIGHQGGSSGTLTVAGTSLAEQALVETFGIDNTIQVGRAGTGVLNVEEFGRINTLHLEAGRSGDGTINIDGGFAVVTAQNGGYSGDDAGYSGFVRAGRTRGGDGEINITNGGRLQIGQNDDTFGPGLQIARNSGSLGAVNVDGAGSQIHLFQTLPYNGDAGVFGPSVQVGRDGYGSLTVTNAGLVDIEGEGGFMGVGQGYGSLGQLTIDGSSSLVRLQSGDVGGTVAIGGEAMSRAEASIDSAGALQLSGNGTSLHLGGEGVVSIHVDGGTIANQGTNAFTSIGGFGAGRAEVTVENFGQLQTTGDIHIGGGGRASLTIQNNGFVTAEAITVFDGGTLAGVGNVNADVFVSGGTVSPGTSPGVMNIGGNFALDEGVLSLEINGDTAGTEYDRLSVSGTASLNGGVVDFDFRANGGGAILNGFDPVGLLTAAGGITYGNEVSYRLLGIDNGDTVNFNIIEGATALSMDITALYGGSDMILQGGNRNDFERGGNGSDFLSGGGGDDTLGGAVGDDTLIGGGGSDTFVALHDNLRDFGIGQVILVTDFNVGQDKIEIIGSSGMGSLFFDEDGSEQYVFFGDPQTGTRTVMVFENVGASVENAAEFVFRVLADGDHQFDENGWQIGASGDGSFTVSQGAEYDSGPVRIGGNTGSASGTATVTDAGSIWRLTTDDFEDSIIIGNDPDGEGDNTGHAGTLNVTDGGTVRIAADEANQELFDSGMLIGRGGHGIVSVSGGGQLEIVDPLLRGGVFMSLGGSNGQPDGVGEVTVTGTDSRISMQGLTATVNVGRNGFGAEGSLSILNGGRFEMHGIDSAGVNMGQGGADGTLLVDGAGSVLHIHSALDPDLLIGIDSNSQGTATVSDGGLVEMIGNRAFLAVGLVGNGESPLSTLSIESGGVVRLGEEDDPGAASADASVSIGHEVNGNGAVTVIGAASALLMTGENSRVTVGNEGSGTLEILDGGVVETLYVQVGRAAGSDGSVWVDGEDSELRLSGRFPEGDGAFLQVGREGDGEMTVSGGASVSIDGDGGDYPGFSVGARAGSTGSLLVTGPGSEIVIGNGGGAIGGGTGYISIGSEGTGSVIVSEGAQVVNAETGFTFVGLDPGSSGTLILSADEFSGATFDAGELMLIGAGYDFDTGAILFAQGGNGLVQVFDGTTLRAGVAQGDGITDIYVGVGGILNVSDGATLDADFALVGGQYNVGASPGTGHFGGDFVVNSGTLDIEVGGLEGGEFDLYDIAGAAALNGGLLSFTALQGYDPLAGDTVTFMTAAGGLTADTGMLDFVFSGVAEGFDYDVTFDGNSASVTVLSDAGEGTSMVFHGGGAASAFTGGDGNDYIDGGAGSDTLTGGEGADIFALRAADAGASLDLGDLVTDFEVGVDSLGLADGLTLADLTLTGSQAGAVVGLQSGGVLAVLQGVSAAETSLEELTASLGA